MEFIWCVAFVRIRAVCWWCHFVAHSHLLHTYTNMAIDKAMTDLYRRIDDSHTEATDERELVLENRSVSAITMLERRTSHHISIHTNYYSVGFPNTPTHRTRRRRAAIIDARKAKRPNRPTSSSSSNILAKNNCGISVRMALNDVYAHCVAAIGRQRIHSISLVVDGETWRRWRWRLDGGCGWAHGIQWLSLFVYSADFFSSKRKIGGNYTLLIVYVLVFVCTRMWLECSVSRSYALVGRRWMV